MIRRALAFAATAGSFALLAIECAPFAAGVAPAEAGAGADAGVEASLGDRADAARDAGEDGADASSTCVAGEHDICDDFADEVYHPGWEPEQGNGGTLAVVDGALRATLPANCDESYAQLIAPRGQAPLSTRVAFDLTVLEGPQPSVQLMLAGVTYDVAGGAYRVDLVLQGGLLRVYENRIFGPGVDHLGDHPVGFVKGEPQHVEVELLLAHEPPAVLLTYGGQAVTFGFPSAIPAPSAQRMKLDFGLYGHAACLTASDVRFHHAAVDFFQ